MPPPAKIQSSKGGSPTPAMLLLDRKAMKKHMGNGGNPSSSKITNAQESSSQSRIVPSYSPHQLLNPRASTLKGNTIKSASMPSLIGDESTPSPGNESDSSQKRRRESNGGNLLENLYGVERRTERPPKQVKVAEKKTDTIDLTQANNSKSSFNHQSNGTIGKFMKNQGEDGTPTSVDLTNLDDDDDDDIKITDQKDISAEVVCYGMVNVTIHAHRIPSSISRQAFDIPGFWPVIPCQIVRDPAEKMIINVTDARHEFFGKLDQNISNALAPVMDAKLEGFRSLVRIPMRKKKDGEGLSGQPTSDIINVQITLYGPRGNVEGIGRRFSQYNCWFQKPPMVDQGISLVNPHANQRRLAGPLAQGSQTTTRTVFTDTRTIEEAANAVSKMFDSIATSDRGLPHMEPGPLITTPLLDHQKQALWFMTGKEKARKFGNEEGDEALLRSLWTEEVQPNGQKTYREIVSGLKLEKEPPQVLGGLLADMMGLGKTIEILSLIATTMREAKFFSEQKLIRSSQEDTQYLRNCKTTLLISPLSAIKNWEDQIREHVQSGGLSYYIYHGVGRTKNAFELANYDIVIATYGTVAYEGSRLQSSSPLHQLRWFRIVLDEAHTIREQNTLQSKIIYNLWATRRWAVTGTPIQNRLEDLGSLVKFLRLYPYSVQGKFNQYIKAPLMAGNPTFLKSLRVFVDSFTLRRLKDQVDLPKREDLVVRLNFSQEEQDLHNFFLKESNARMQIITSKRTKGSSYHHILTSIMTLRLVSAHGRDLLNSRDRARLRGATKSEALDVDETSPQSQLTESSAYEMLDLMTDAGFNLCMQCQKQIATDPQNSTDDQEELSGVMLSCYDIMCTDCFASCKPDFEAGNPELPCPICSAVISSHYVDITWEGLDAMRVSKEQETAEPRQKTKKMAYQGPHTKTKALLDDLAKAKELSIPLVQKGEPPIKSVVFSEFTTHLDLIGRALKDTGYNFTRIDGTMNLSQRRKVLDAFNDDKEIVVLLASIKAAGQGLNLTAASRAFIMEPLWNPAAEQQAVDRVHRLGQTRDVIITRYLMNNSIEIKIREMQNAKQKMADISMNKNHKALSKQEIREENIKILKSLFK